MASPRTDGRGRPLPARSVAWTAADMAAQPLAPNDPGARWTPVTSTAAWLAALRSPHTRRGYLRDLADFLAWLDAAGLDPRQARTVDVDLYLAALRERPCPPSPASQRRRLAALSGWYGHLVSTGIVTANPLVAVKRP